MFRIGVNPIAIPNIYNKPTDSLYISVFTIISLFYTTLPISRFVSENIGEANYSLKF